MNTRAQIYKDIANYVQSCETCQKCEMNQRGKIGLMGTREIDMPWKVVSADLIGPLPTSKSGYKYLIIFEDLLSKFIICAPCKNRKANLILKEVFVSENAKEFKSGILKNFLNENAIKHEFTPTYHPQSNAVERVKSDIKIKITAYINETHKE